MARKITALDRVMDCIDRRQDFVLQGGAGSGKTETLSQLIFAATMKAPNIRIACITHTNKAADEIASRITGNHSVSTIHSFINQLISGYKKNIHEIISRLFEIDQMIRLDDAAYPDEKTQKIEEHSKYKKIYEQLSARLFIVKGTRLEKVEGKKLYDADPIKYNLRLNEKIDVLNSEIKSAIKGKVHQSIEYNETRFNDFHTLSYGHDGLLLIASWLFDKFPLIGKVIADKYDCIFIDEYQDTNEKIVSLFLNLPIRGETTVGFFGDSMQAIYSDGIKSLEPFVESGRLIKIEKEDNYRCSEQVIYFINTLRDDGLKQQVAFKIVQSKEETIDERQGSVEIYYSICDNKPHSRSSETEKEAYTAALNRLIDKASFDGDFKTLLLSNKAVAGKAGFARLYEIFSDRYLEPKEEIDRILTRLQLLDLYEICEAFQSRNYNFVLAKLKKSGLSIQKSSDKNKISSAILSIIKSETGAINSIKQAFELRILQKSEGFSEYLNRVESALVTADADESLKRFRADFDNDGHTFAKMNKRRAEIDEDYFNEQKRNLEQVDFFRNILSDKFSLQEAFNYFKYEDEQTPFITMHKTKGTGINNVLVVLDEYFWNEYDFRTVFDVDELDQAKRLKNLRLVYVACSRTKHNLRCVRLVSSDERDQFLDYCKDYKIIEIN